MVYHKPVGEDIILPLKNTAIYGRMISSPTRKNNVLLPTVIPRQITPRDRYLRYAKFER